MDVDESLLEESAEELYENAPCGYISTLPDGTIVKVNQTFLQWSGYERDDLLAGRRFQDLLTVAGKIFHETHYAPLLRMQGRLDEIALDLVGKDGRPLPVLVNTVQKRDAVGTPLLNRTTIFNATDRREYERELLLARRKAEQAAKAKSFLLSMISHDVRNPLAAIASGLALLERSGPSPTQQRYLRLMQASLDSLLALTDNVLTYSRIESGIVSLAERPFDLRRIVEGIVASLRARAEEKNLTLDLSIDERLPTMLIGDTVKIGQVLTNLLGNALKFTDEGGVTLSVILVGIEGDTASLVFAVTDTGIGIPRDRLAHIFEEFAQAGPDTGVTYGGTGLGLAISRKLLELYGSRISVDSTPGKGSTFSFTLRLKVPRTAD